MTLVGSQFIKFPSVRAMLPLLFIAIVLFLKLSTPEWYRKLTYENGFFEWLQVVFLLIGSFFSLAAAILTHVFLKNMRAVWFAHFLIAIGLLLIVMEEISWGQWLFDRELSAYFRDNNTQQNITLHNLGAIQPLLHSAYIALSLFASSLCLFTPIIRAKTRLLLPLSFLPESWLALYFLPLGLFYLFGDWISPLLVSAGITGAEVSFNHRTTFIFWSDQESLEVPFTLGIAFYSLTALRRTLSYIPESPRASFFWRRIFRTLISERYILSLFSLFLCFWFRDYFTSGAVPSVDLPSFISGVELLQNHLPYGRVSFYDPTTFGGWTPFLLYGVVPSIFVACLAWCVEFFTHEPARLATHLTLVFGCALFPWTFSFAVKPFIRSLIPQKHSNSWTGFLSILSVITYSFWFLNHDHQWFGIGAAAPMNIGLISQLFAWHFLLLYFGALVRITTHERSEDLHVGILALSFGLLLPTHILSAVYALFLGGLTILLYASKRRSLLYSHLLGFGISAFWLLPFLQYVGEIAPLDIHRPSGDFLELFFRYPAWGVFQTLHTAITNKEMPNLHTIYFLNMLLLVLLFSNNRFQREGVHHTFFLFILCSILFFSSGFVASGLQVGFHYYRFMAYGFLFLTVLFASLPLILVPLTTEYRSRPTLIFIGVTTILAVCLIQTARLPHYEREMIRKLAATNYLFQEDAVVRHFSSLPKKGRIYVEYFNNYKKFPKLSAHYLASRLPKEAGFEVLPNSHLQEAPAYRMIAGTARLLGANTYNVPLLFTDNAELSKEVLLQQLRDFGVTHIVAGTSSFIENLMKLDLDKKRIGRYVIFSLRKDRPLTVEPVTGRTLVGYRDLRGNLPFHLVQYYFYSRENLYKNFELVQLPLNGNPPQVPLVLINEESITPVNKIKRSKVEIHLNFHSEYTLDHYNVHYPHNTELDAYRKIEQYFDSEFMLEEQLLGFPAARSIPTPLATEARGEWQNHNQRLSLTGLQPGVWQRVNYTYSPLFRSDGGSIFRGMGERLYLFPSAEKMTLHFSRWNDVSSWLGLFITALAIVLISRIFIHPTACDTL